MRLPRKVKPIKISIRRSKLVRLRGLDDFRVRVQENGIGSMDVSDLGQDHGVPIDPLSIQKIEIFRGPEALRYGSQAVGGGVEATNIRIPFAAPVGGWQAQIMAATTTVDRGLEGGALFDAATKNFAFHSDSYGRNAPRSTSCASGSARSNTNTTSWVLMTTDSILRARPLTTTPRKPKPRSSSCRWSRQSAP